MDLTPINQSAPSAGKRMPLRGAPSSKEFIAMSAYPFHDLAPSRYLWVDSKAAAGGDGSRGNPLNSIQTALAKAKPGTAIMVREGDYPSVTIPRTADGTPDKPIWLISADGPQAAHIIANDNSRAGITGGGVENFIVDGFRVTGGKNGIHFGQNGFDYSDMVTNIVVRNNVIENPREDGVKANGGEHVYVYNNKITGGVDEGIDFVAIVHGVIADNEISGNTGSSAGIFAKLGSQDILITGNYVHDNAASGISVGGYNNPDRLMRDGYDTFQAKDVTVGNNVIVRNGKAAMTFYGAHDTSVSGNYIEANPKYFAAMVVGSNSPDNYRGFLSKGVVIRDNFIADHKAAITILDKSTAVAYRGNKDAAAREALEEWRLEVPSGQLPGAPEPKPQPSPGPESDPLPRPEPSPGIKLIPLEQLFGKEWSEGDTPLRTVRDGVGTAGADRLMGRSNHYAGAGGDDTYVIGEAALAKVKEAAGGGVDTIEATGRHLALPEHVENLELASNGGAILVGNASDNRLLGNAGSDYLIGGGGDNWLLGGGGGDHFVVGEDDRITRIADFGQNDRLHISGSTFSSFAEIKDALVERSGSVVLRLDDGRAVMFDDSSISSLSAEQFGFGRSTDAQAGAKASGKAKAAGSATHIAEGGAGNDQLKGSGDSVLVGKGGDDRYTLRTPGDHVIEEADGGIDTVVLLHGHYVIESAVENVIVRHGGPTFVLGNGLANQIWGGSGADYIVGGKGADHLRGGDGADLFAYRSLDEGGDTILDFEVGRDHLDVSALRELGAAFHSEVSGKGTAIYADMGQEHYLLAVLDNVTDALPVTDFLV
ncbi:right-handed parallel beta-helix repeat-containing protein [Sphingomonas sp. LY54]|uniref:right-handed parallel beta-helix repeat-containing protein n=1 Tax=Sphingomonas sp. LY54 TaxID=3095343 RepID=UPI002D76DC8F|nr:right-handed parallel beta-helix repeat-containing protein [Sphingomonas sp. LY54]WRP28197.1 right-handed parallel beta-helix repeat-containing protein [Sphingomonas sp. LY54]